MLWCYDARSDRSYVVGEIRLWYNGTTRIQTSELDYTPSVFGINYNIEFLQSNFVKSTNSNIVSSFLRRSGLERCHHVTSYLINRDINSSLTSNCNEVNLMSTMANVDSPDPSKDLLPIEAAEEESAAPPVPEEPKVSSRKDASLKEFLSKMDDYAPIVRKPYHLFSRV